MSSAGHKIERPPLQLARMMLQSSQARGAGHRCHAAFQAQVLGALASSLPSNEALRQLQRCSQLHHCCTHSDIEAA